jgi:hypothetical protein
MYAANATILVGPNKLPGGMNQRQGDQHVPKQFTVFKLSEMYFNNSNLISELELSSLFRSDHQSQWMEGCIHVVE